MRNPELMRVFDPRKASEFEKYLRFQIDIVKIIAEYVNLTKKGKHYEGRCPFHPDGVIRDISVYPSKQMFVCMSAGCSGGDVFDFIAKKHSCNREGAVRILADKLGIRANVLDEFPQKSKDSHFHVSFSMLKLFQQCPLRYKYRYLDGRADQKTTYYLALGRILHKTLAEFFRISAEHRSLSLLLDMLKENWKSRQFSNEEEERECKLRSQEILTNYYTTHNCSVKTWQVEAFVKYRVRGLTISGTVDRIDELPDGAYEIIDYKTEPFASGEENMNTMQLAFYYYGISESYHLPVGKLTLEYITSQESISMSPSKVELEKQISKAHEIVKIIQETKEFRPKKNMYCMDCLFAQTCPELKK